MRKFKNHKTLLLVSALAVSFATSNIYASNMEFNEHDIEAFEDADEFEESAADTFEQDSPEASEASAEAEETWEINPENNDPGEDMDSESIFDGEEEGWFGIDDEISSEDDKDDEEDAERESNQGGECTVENFHSGIDSYLRGESYNPEDPEHPYISCFPIMKESAEMSDGVVKKWYGIYTDYGYFSSESKSELIETVLDIDAYSDFEIVSELE